MNSINQKKKTTPKLYKGGDNNKEYKLFTDKNPIQLTMTHLKR